MKTTTEYRTGSVEKPSKPSTFVGVDTMSPNVPSAFRWQGSGLLMAVTSDWQMVRHDADYRWAVIVFGDTTFTKAGETQRDKSRQALVIEAISAHVAAPLLTHSPLLRLPLPLCLSGCSILYREPVIPDEVMAEVRAAIDADPYLKERAINMFRPVQDPRGRQASK